MVLVVVVAIVVVVDVVMFKTSLKKVSMHYICENHCERNRK